MADFDRSVNKMAYEMKIVIVEYRKLDDRIAGSTCIQSTCILTTMAQPSI